MSSVVEDIKHPMVQENANDNDNDNDDNCNTKKVTADHVGSQDSKRRKRNHDQHEEMCEEKKDDVEKRLPRMAKKGNAEVTHKAKYAIGAHVSKDFDGIGRSNSNKLSHWRVSFIHAHIHVPIPVPMNCTNMHYLRPLFVVVFPRMMHCPTRDEKKQHLLVKL